LAKSSASAAHFKYRSASKKWRARYARAPFRQLTVSEITVSLAGVIADEVARSENLAFHRRDDRVAIRIRRVEVELRVQREDLEVVWMRFARRRLRSDIARLACDILALAAKFELRIGGKSGSKTSLR
jgi:hypothetical protein